jgi:hypothetical protein
LQHGIQWEKIWNQLIAVIDVGVVNIRRLIDLTRVKIDG